MSNKKHMLKKISIAIVILIIAIVAAYYWSTRPEAQPQTQNQASNVPTQSSAEKDGSIVTSDWKTFSSEKFKIAFKYPPSWKLSTTVRDNTIVVDKNPNEDIYDNAKLMIINNYWEHGVIGLTMPPEQKDIVLDNVPVTLDKYRIDSSDTTGLVIINFNDNQNRPRGIEFKPSVNDVDNDLRIFDGILSTISFLE